MDEDLENLSRDELIAAAKALRAGIRKHRDSTGHDLCWYHPELWGLLPDKAGLQVSVPEWPEFMHCCVAYRKSLEDEL